MAVGKMNVVLLLDQVEELLESCPRVPLTGKVMINGDELLDLLDQIRGALPEEVKRAEWIAQEKDRLLRDTQEEAARIIKQAEDYARKLLEESELLAEARAEAQKIVREAQARAKELTGGAAEYADRVLGDLAGQLEQTLKVIARGREELGKKFKGGDSAEPRPDKSSPRSAE
ncbi:MAG TPA: ATPase [Firmicutes bacterium]|nr:ATPase [Bacillota bacterium]